MKYCRLLINNEPQFALVETEGSTGRELITRVFKSDPCARIPDEDAASRRIDPIPLENASLLTPVLPSKIVCIGRNYKAHAAELGNPIPEQPLVFFKPPSSLADPGAQIRLPKLSEMVHYEGELAVVIGKSCYKVQEGEDVRDYVLGYTILNDVTARDLQKKENQWARAKGFDTFTPVGPVVVDGLDPWAGIEVETRINGEVRQHGTTADFIFPLDVIIRHITAAMTLVPGDVIATGTPEGVGELHAGDVVEMTVQGVGTLRNTVVNE
ncbi:MAG: fumarylacetoacetate hydrolase family protein [Terriglobales bacterium]|jgi:2-keto-4-pentenoate hydratase/2-oxohepta-3-ene-1,7-dioic acid hydratase in catechol pathway